MASKPTPDPSPEALAIARDWTSEDVVDELARRIDAHTAAAVERAREAMTEDFTTNWLPTFVRLRQAVRDAIHKIAGIPSNPGWTDDDVLQGLRRAVEIVRARGGNRG